MGWQSDDELIDELKAEVKNLKHWLYVIYKNMPTLGF